MIASQDGPMTIQQVSQATGLSIHTLRYYERIDLLEPVARATNGHRRYSRQDVERIIFLNYLRLTCMSLEQMKVYSALLRQGEAGIPARVAMLSAHRDEVERWIEELSRVLGVIDIKIGLMTQDNR